MDILTHLAIGTVIAAAFAREKTNRAVLIAGATAQCAPDLDVVAALWLPPDQNVLVHRGITHSLLAAIVLPFVFAWLSGKWKGSFQSSTWVLFFMLQYAVHLFVDVFNAYGAGLLEPFDQRKFSLNTLYVADPFFSVAPVVAAIFLFFQPSGVWRSRLVIGGLVLCSLYLAYAVRNRLVGEKRVVAALSREEVRPDRLLLTPAPLNSWLWFAAAEVDSGYFLAYTSVYDTGSAINWTFTPGRKNLIAGEKSEVIANLIQFSDGYYTIEQWSDTLVFNDLRFGQISGWSDPSSRFAFHYYINFPDANRTVMQRGRFSGWNLQTVRSYARRIAGYSDESE